MILTRNKYHLYIINKTKNIIDLLRDILYVYKYKEMIISNMNNSCTYFKDKILWF